MTPRRTAEVIGVIACVLLFGYFAVARGLFAQNYRLQGPADWVAFTADVRNLSGGQEAPGRFYRDSLGSTRMDSYFPDRSQRVVTIHNQLQRMTYQQSPDGSWAAFPMQPSAPTVPDVERTVSGMKVLSEETWEGRSAYRIQVGTQTYLRMPELNLFDVVVAMADGTRIEYYNIRLENPPSDLFLPPAGVDVRQATSIKDLLRLPGRK